MKTEEQEATTLYSLAARVGQAASEALRARPEDAGVLLEQIIQDAAQMKTRLERSGATAPASLAMPSDVPLELLDTPANRRYERLLVEAWEAGKAVDRERFGADIGTDGPSQLIEMVLADVQQEIHGAAGSGLE